MPTAPATTKTASARRDLFSALESVAADISREKSAAAGQRTKVAGPTPPDPGGYAGKSSHPSASIDNNVQGANTGERASENSSDVKAEVGAPSVDSTAEATNKDGSGDQDKQQLNIGTEQSATGEDPSTEDDYKGTKDDPGTSHPAKTEDGEKYGSVKFAEAKTRANTLANSILADLANGFGSQLLGGVKVAGAKPAAAPAKPATKAAASAGVTPGLLNKAASAVQGNPAAQAGYELAAILGVEKSAAEAAVAASIEATINDAQLDATLFGNYFSNYQKRAAARPKTAGDDEGGEDHSSAGDSASGAGGGEGSAAPPPSDAGGDMGGGELAGGGGGDSLGDLLGGGSDPGGMMGGAPPDAGGMGGDMGGGVSKQQALEQLVSALMELGIPIDQLAAAGGEGGAPPPGAGGPPGMGAPPPGMGAPPPGGDLTGGAPPPPSPAGLGGGGGDPMSEGMKLASAARAFQRSGQFRFKEAADGSRERQLRDEMKAYVIDLIKTANRR